MKPTIGRARRELFDWLTTTWLDEGPAVCFLQGFAGIGKSELARDVKQHCHARRLPTAIADVTSPTATLNDVLFALSGDLASAGLPALGDAISASADLLPVLELTLRKRCMLIIDDAQCLFERTSGKPGVELTTLLRRLKNQPAYEGRVLIIIDRKFDAPEWAEVFEVRELHKLDLKEGCALLDALLAAARRDRDVPNKRRRGIVVALDSNPRALQTFVGCLAFDSLDNILGEDPGLWALGDRTMAARLVHQLESRLLEKTFQSLESRARNFLQSLSVHRTAFQKSAMNKLGSAFELEQLIEILIQRFVLRQRSGLYSVNPIAREISVARLRSKTVALKRAHSVAADYHLGPFKGRQMSGDIVTLTPRFAELRYHLANAARSDELREVVQRFTGYLRTGFSVAQSVPPDRETIDEHIGVLSVLLEEPGADELEYYLAKLLELRRGPGDLAQAVVHITRATARSSKMAFWLLRIRIERAANGISSALAALKMAFKAAADADTLEFLYLRGAELYAAEKEFVEAIALLEQGLLYVRKERRAAIYHLYANVLHRMGQTGAAIGLLEERGVKDTFPEHSFSLYEYCAELYYRNGDAARAVALLREGFEKIPATKGLWSLYRVASRILAETGRVTEALAVLNEGGRRLSGTADAPVMYEHAMLICLSTGNRDGLQQLTNDEQMPEAQSVYGRALLAIYDDNWEGALAELRREPWFSPPQARLTALRAFCALSTNSPRLANETLARLDLSVGRPGRQATYWLRAMIALRLQDEETVRRNIEALLERPVTGAEELTLDFLLKYWDESPNSWHGVTVAFVFPKLPPSITRLDKAIVRPPYGGPILPKVTEVLSATQDEREARRTGPVVLCVATEWHSAHGGLSTFNRQLAIAIARTGSIVYCYVPHCSHDEIEAAQSVGVTLIASPDRANSSDAARLRRRPPLHPNFEPNVIIGHDRITGAEAQALTSDFFPNSKNVLFIHTAPREIEWYKEPDPTETSTGAADERARFQKELALKADVVAAVGPKLFAAIQTELVGESRQPLLARIDPGMVVSHDIPEEPQIVNCLLLGRAEDDSLKGLDIAARAMGILRSRFEATGSRKPTLVVRGAVTASGDTLRHQLLAISRNPQLHIDIRPFTATSAQIISEIKSTWALLMPSRSEGFGLVALEAIGVGAPVLVGEQSGIATLLRAECPDLADNAIVAYHGELEKDANEWANRIEFVLRDRAAALVRATELRDRLAPKLSWDRAAAELFASLVKTDQHSAGT